MRKFIAVLFTVIFIGSLVTSVLAFGDEHRNHHEGGKTEKGKTVQNQNRNCQE